MSEESCNTLESLTAAEDDRGTALLGLTRVFLLLRLYAFSMVLNRTRRPAISPTQPEIQERSLRRFSPVAGIIAKVTT